MSVESSLNLTPTLSLVRRGSINLVSPQSIGGTRACFQTRNWRGREGETRGRGDVFE
jgi:hypothetical protein